MIRCTDIIIDRDVWSTFQCRWYSATPKYQQWGHQCCHGHAASAKTQRRSSWCWRGRRAERKSITTEPEQYCKRYILFSKLQLFALVFFTRREIHTLSILPCPGTEELLLVVVHNGIAIASETSPGLARFSTWCWFVQGYKSRPVSHGFGPRPPKTVVCRFVDCHRPADSASFTRRHRL